MTADPGQRLTDAFRRWCLATAGPVAADAAQIGIRPLAYADPGVAVCLDGAQAARLAELLEGDTNLGKPGAG